MAVWTTDDESRKGAIEVTVDFTRMAEVAKENKEQIITASLALYIIGYFFLGLGGISFSSQPALAAYTDASPNDFVVNPGETIKVTVSDEDDSQTEESCECSGSQTNVDPPRYRANASWGWCEPDDSPCVLNYTDKSDMRDNDTFITTAPSTPGDYEIQGWSGDWTTQTDCYEQYGDCNTYTSRYYDDVGKDSVSVCVKETCSTLGAQCGSFSDGCGGTIDCGSCSGSETCSSGSCVCPDSDGDGYTDDTCGGLDCNDGNSSINPDAEEVCNGVDDDCDGNVDEGGVCNSPPTASFDYSPSDPRAQEQITFDASSSTDDNGIDTYEWDWTRDGVWETTGQTVDHAYSSEGDYNVTLRVTDTDGVTDQTSQIVSVETLSVEITDISLSTACTLENTKMDVQCTSDPGEINCVGASLGGQDCSFQEWTDSNTAEFECAVGSQTTDTCGSGDSYEARCFVQTSKCAQTGTDKTDQVYATPSDCSEQHSTESACNDDPSCEWCPQCSGNKWSGYDSGKCVSDGSCSYACDKGTCGAECDRDVGTGDTTCSDLGYDGGDLDCDYSTCTYDESACFNDDSPPSTSVSGAEEGVWYNKNRTLTFDPDDDVGIDHVEFCVTQSASCSPDTGQNGTSVELTVEGENIVFYRAVDVNGNVEETNNITVKLDKSEPIITVPAVKQDGSLYKGGPTEGPIRLTVDCSDSLSGCKANTKRLKVWVFEEKPDSCPGDRFDKTVFDSYDITPPHELGDSSEEIGTFYVCGAAKDVAGNYGFGGNSPAPREIRIEP